MKKLSFAVAAVPIVLSAAPSEPPTIEAFLAPGYPTQVVSARNVDRIAWTAYEHGLRNVYTAAAPAFAPVRLTGFAKDDGVELSDVAISSDGSVVTFVRGTPPNREGWVANPTSNPAGAARTVWAVRTSGGSPWKIGEMTTPVLPRTDAPSRSRRTDRFSDIALVQGGRVQGCKVQGCTVHLCPMHLRPMHLRTMHLRTMHPCTLSL